MSPGTVSVSGPPPRFIVWFPTPPLDAVRLADVFAAKHAFPLGSTIRTEEGRLLYVRQPEGWVRTCEVDVDR